MTGVQRENLQVPAGATTLVIFIHGLQGTPAGMAGLARAARDAIPAAATYTPLMCYGRQPRSWRRLLPRTLHAIRRRGTRGGLFSLTPPELAASDLLAQADALVREHGFERVILAGHSMGSLIARKLVVLAHGETPADPERGQIGAAFEAGLARWREPLPWAGRIERLVLSAGILRGWSNNAAHGVLASMLWSLGALLGEMLANGRWTVLQTRVGAPFVVQTRLQWLALMRRPSPPAITAVQMLGSVDDTVAPEDTIDFLSEITRKRFVMLQLPATNHAEAIAVEGSPAAVQRRAIFMAALTRSADELANDPHFLPAQFVTNGPPPVADTSVDDVVFVIHGIRDRGFWTQKIAHKVMGVAAEAHRIARSMTLSYGYLAMGPFLLPWVRRDKVRWLMDRYADTRALYPTADFHYVGHSNGTYLAARALRDYPAASFRRVVFAGSVVRCDYDWTAAAAARRQVEAILNYVASGDWVVAIFPNGVSRFPAFDLGGAGHLGFDHFKDGIAVAAPNGARLLTKRIGEHDSYQIDFVQGSHGAGIKESQWDEIADFIVRGQAPLPDNADFIGGQTPWVSRSAKWPPVAFGLVIAAALLVIALLAAGAAWLGTSLAGTAIGGWIAGAVALVACVLLVRLVITRL